MPFLPLFTGIRHLAHVLIVPPTKAPTLRYTSRPGLIYTGHAFRHLPNAVPWISEDRLAFGLYVTDNQIKRYVLGA